MAELTNDGLKAFLKEHGFQSHVTPYWSSGTLKMFRDLLKAVEVADTQRLDAIAQHSWDLRSFDMPTGQGDANIGWKVVEYMHAGEVEIAVAYKDDPRVAIDQAIAATAPEVPRG